MNSLSRSDTLTTQLDNPELDGVPPFFRDFLPKEQVEISKSKEILPTKKMPYTSAEKQFIVFSKGFFEQVQQDNRIILLRTTNERQAEFNQWIKDSASTETFKPDDLNINSLIASVWLKSRNNILVNLLKVGTIPIFKDELECQKKAHELEEEILQSESKVKFFTYRQVKFLYPRMPKLFPRAKV